MMKQLFNLLKATSLVVLVLFTYACTTSDDSDPGGGNEPVELSISNIVGRWGIQSTVTNGGAPQTQTPCRNTLQILQNGDFILVDANAGAWLEGNATFNQADSVLTLTIAGQVLTAKILSVSETAFELESTDGSGATTSISVSQFVKLDREDCSQIRPSEISAKWNIDEFQRTAFQIEGGGRGDVLGIEQGDDQPYLWFTIQFKEDGSFVMIDLVNELDYGIGTYRTLDNYNYIVSFEDEESGQTEEQLIHITAVGQGTMSVLMVERDTDEAGEEIIIETTFDLSVTNGSEPTINKEMLEGKWSASTFAQRAFLDGQMVGELVNDMIPHNKLTLEFFDDGGLQLIDLVDDVGFNRGSYVLLDGSNILIDTGEDGEGDHFELFHVIAVDGDRFTIRNFQRPGHRGEGGEGNGGGEANNGDDPEYDVLHFEITANKNSGDEPAINGEELLGEWLVTQVEDLRPAGTGSNEGEGPQEGMVLNFAAGGTGAVTFEQQEVATFEYELIDANNLAMIFEDNEGDGGESNDGHEEENNYTIFHVSARPGGAVEVILYEPSRSDDHDGDGGDGTGGGEANDGHDQGDGEQENNGGPTYRIVMQKEG